MYKLCMRAMRMAIPVVGLAMLVACNSKKTEGGAASQTTVPAAAPAEVPKTVAAETPELKEHVVEKVTRTEEEWKKSLTPEQYRVLRQKGTEAPRTGEYEHTKTKGVYSCAACGAELFRSDAKFDSGCGWPSFFTPLAKNAVVETVDNSLGMRRTEITCAACGGHLGHVFDDAPDQPTGLRYCINSVSLKLVASEDAGKAVPEAKK